MKKTKRHKRKQPLISFPSKAFLNRAHKLNMHSEAQYTFEGEKTESALKNL